MRKRYKITVGTLSVAAIAAIALLLSPRPDLSPDGGFSLAVQDRDGQLLRLALANDDRYRLKVSLDEVATTAIDATLLYEDQYFWSHPGFNPAALLRAGWSTYVKKTRPMGASTITMQLARMRYAMNTRTIRGKFAQVVRAMQIERHYSKSEILEAYLNLAPYGGNIEGIGTAALVYFDKSAAELALPEALALAVIAQNPAARNLSTPTGYREMSAARSRLLNLWTDKYDISDEALAVFELPLKVRNTRELPFHAPHFSSQVLGANSHVSGTLKTSLDLRKQHLIETQIQRYVERKRALGIHNASAMLLDYRSMEILAAVGSANFFDTALSGQVSGTTAKRSPGSTLKPFVYGLAIDQGIIHPMSLLKDAPKRFSTYTPENFDRGFMGPIKAVDALVYSRNVPAIELLSKVGHNDFHKFLIDAEVEDLAGADHYGLAMILGGNELTMTELVRLYAMLANGGISRPLRNASSRSIDFAGNRLLSAEASYLVLDMLRHNPRPDSVNLKIANRESAVAWKTGTSYAYRDAWSIGVFGPYVLAVWVGNFDGSGNPAFVGRSAAAPLFFDVVDALQEHASDPLFSHAPSPDLNLAKVEVCANTGDLPGRYCPRTVPSWFVPGVSPITVSNVHRGIRVDKQTGKRSCSFASDQTRVAVYEFWPSDILELFQQAGIAIRRPPAWSDECSMDTRTAGGVAPRITSPSAELTYYVRPGSSDNARIALQATTDADVKWLYWFADDRFLAKVSRDEALFWQPQVGKHDITAVDDLGRTHQRRLTVARAL